MKNIHLIPTDKPSRLVLETKNSNLFITSTYFKNDLMKHQNIYITNDEEIKKGDWFLNTLNGKLDKCDDLIYEKNVNLSNWCKKIILTTDPDLIKDGVQAITNTFAEWFVKNPSCEEVETNTFCCREISKNYCDLKCGKQTYKIIIPQETLSYTEAAKKDERIFNSTMMKQETVDEVNDNRKNLYFKKQVMNPYAVEEYSHTAYEKGFIEGYEESNKYQAERMYSEEEVIELLQKYRYDLSSGKTPNIGDTTKVWFEQFKKK
jgi:hypothetical protein